MKTFRIRPVAALAPFVERLWGWESVGDEVIELPTLLPGTGSEIFFHYNAPFRRTVADKVETFGRTHLICVRHQPIKLCSSNAVGFVAVRFRAGCLHRFTNVAGVELLDQTITAADLWGSEGRRIAREAVSGLSRAGIVELLQGFLVDRLQQGQSDHLVEKAVAKIYQRYATVSVDQLASGLGVTRRQLERRFHALIAQTPVEVRRLSRLQKTLRQLLLQKSASVLDVALSHGYYDQAHFIHDFAKLGLGSPQRHLKDARLKAHFYNAPGQTFDTPAF